MDILFTQELARRLAGTGVTANSCCPGLNASGLGRESKVLSRLAAFLDWAGLFRPEAGARILVRLATAPELAGVSGEFFSPRGASFGHYPRTDATGHGAATTPLGGHRRAGGRGRIAMSQGHGRDELLASVGEQVGALVTAARSLTAAASAQLHPDLQPAAFHIVQWIKAFGPAHAGAIAEGSPWTRAR